MPKTPRTHHQVQKIRARILDEAITLITAKGFHNLSMRTIASRVGMTAANIYNYYQGKDELYLDIQTQGFVRLNDCLQQAVEKHSRGGRVIDPVRGVSDVMRAYLSFGMSWPSLYEIMFILNTPKYADYRHTRLEPVALVEKETALQAIHLLWEALGGFPEEISCLTEKEVYFRIIQLWTALHGIVSLYNSRVLQEVEEDTEVFIERCVNAYSRLFFRGTGPEEGVAS